MHNFLVLFFTHKYQIYNSLSINPWLLLDPKSYSVEPNQKNENQLNLVYIIDTQPNNLSIEIDVASIYVDCSQPVKTDNPITADSYFLSGNYKLLNFDLIHPSSLTETKYNVVNQEISLTYPYFNSINNANYQNIKLNSNSNINSISVSNVPYGNKIIKRYRDTTLISYITDNTLEKGYLPNETLNNKLESTVFNTVDLYTWSISLLALITLEEDLLIYNALVSILNIFNQHKLNNPLLHGLPDILSEQNSSYSLQRSTFKNSWAGYCILQALGYLSNRPTNKILSIPFDIKSVLVSITNLISDCINNDIVCSGYDIYGGRIDNYDLCSTYITDIFLNQYSCYFFDFDLYYKNNLIHNHCASSIYLDYENLLYSVNNIIQINIYKCFWINYFDTNTQELNNIFSQINRLQSTFSLSDYDYNLLALLNLQLKADDSITTSLTKFEFTNLYRSYLDTNLYIRKDRPLTDDFLHLIDTSWGTLLQSNTNLINPIIYKMSNELVNYETLDLLKTLTDTWPTGIKWTSYVTANDKTTAIGSIFSSIAFVSLYWSLLRNYLNDSTSCTTSQGYNLDKWGNVLRYYRPENQADYYYKNSLLLLLNRTPPTVDNLKTFIFNFLEDINVEIIKYTFPPLYYLNSSNVWVSRPWVGNKADVDLINSQLDINGYPSFYLPNTLGNMVLNPVYKFTGQVDIISENLDISNSNIISNLLPAGITSNIKSISTYNHIPVNTSFDFSIITA